MEEAKEVAAKEMPEAFYTEFFSVHYPDYISWNSVLYEWVREQVVQKKTNLKGGGWFVLVWRNTYRRIRDEELYLDVLLDVMECRGLCYHVHCAQDIGITVLEPKP